MSYFSIVFKFFFLTWLLTLVIMCLHALYRGTLLCEDILATRICALFCSAQSYVSNPYWLQICYVGEVVLELMIFLSLFSTGWDCRHVPWHLVKLHKSGSQFYYQYLQDFSAITIIISNFLLLLFGCLLSF